MKAVVRAAHKRRRRLHEGRQQSHGGSEGCMKEAPKAARGAATAARRQQGLHEGGEGGMKAPKAAEGAATAARRQRGLHKSGEDRRCGSARHRRVRVCTDRLIGGATGPQGEALIR
jgi:hypothetical protein